MPKPTIERLSHSFEFYRKLYTISIYACLTQFVIICCLSLALFYGYFTQKPSTFFATTTDGDVIELDTWN